MNKPIFEKDLRDALARESRAIDSQIRAIDINRRSEELNGAVKLFAFSAVLSLVLLICLALSFLIVDRAEANVRDQAVAEARFVSACIEREFKTLKRYLSATAAYSDREVQHEIRSLRLDPEVMRGRKMYCLKAYRIVDERNASR